MSGSVGHLYLRTLRSIITLISVPAVDRREVVVVVYDGVVMLDVTGPTSVLHAARSYRIRLASADGRSVRSDVGISIGVDLSLSDMRSSFHTLIVPGYSPGTGEPPAALIERVRAISLLAQRVVSVCTGAFLVARAGLLDGRRATTHWSACADLAAQFPRVRVEPDAIFVQDGAVFTSAGVTAGIDLALALVEEDHDAETARTVGKYLVVFLQRPGGQSQFSVRSTVNTPRNAALRTVLDAITEDPAGDHGLTAMANRATVSKRHLTRLFQQQVGIPPAKYVQRVRVEAAKTLLETSDKAVSSVARACGFSSEETLRRTLVRAIGVPPDTYRRRFRTARPQTSQLDS